VRLGRVTALLRRLYARICNRRPPLPDSQGTSSLNELFVTLVHQAVERGAGEQAIVAAIDQGAQAAAVVVADRLEADAPRMLREHKAIRDGFERRLQQRWGPALNLYECVYVCCLEAGESFQNKHGDSARQSVDAKFSALTLLHGRSCMVTSEIYGLLRTGHAAGAQARWRTLHELAVVAFTLAASDCDISERFLLHRGVEQYKDAERYQKHCEDLGYEKFSDEEMKEMRRASDDLVARYGTDFRRDWGWAKPLFPGNEQPNFASLERRAGFEHLRPWYRLANHGIHSGATGTIHVIDFYGRGREMLAGPSNFGLADPANGALIALHQVTAALLIHGAPTPPEAEDIITFKAIQVMLDRAERAFLEIHSALEEEEAALQATNDRRSGQHLEQ
jgi:hypothetical protein